MKHLTWRHEAGRYWAISTDADTKWTSYRVTKVEWAVWELTRKTAGRKVQLFLGTFPTAREARCRAERLHRDQKGSVRV